MKKEYSILDIINGCNKKEAKYQRALVDQYAGFLYILCKRYLNDDGYAQDMVQDSLVKIFKNLNKFDAAKGSFEAWISTIAIRTCLTQLSKKRFTILNLEDQSSIESIDENSRIILDELETGHLIEMIKELPDGYREVFNLAAIDGYAHKEIAEMMEITEENSRSRLARAKKILRRKIINLKTEERWVNSI